MAKKIEFILDVDSKPIDVAVDATLNLKQQFRELSKELNRTKEGTREFELLSSKLGEVKDNMDTTAAKSKDLFGSLSLLPGPVGQFAGSVDNAIGSLKLFTSFKFSDLKFQLKETIDDFKGIAANIGKATGITKIYTTLNNALAASFVKVGVGEAAAATGARAFAAALTATGIGLLVVALGYLIGKLMEAGEEADVTAIKVSRLNAELETQRTNSKLYGEQLIAQLKAQGATEDQLYKARKDLKEKDLNDARNAYKISQTLIDGAIVMDQKETEGYKQAVEARKKAAADIKQFKSDLVVMGFNEEERIRKENEQKDKEAKNKAIATSKEANDKILQDRKTFNDKLIAAQTEFLELSAKNEYEAEIIKIQRQKESDIAEINRLKINEEEKAKLISQITINAEKRKQVVLDKMQKKASDDYNEFVKERDQATNEINKKASEMRTQMIKDEFEREKKTLQDRAKEEIKLVRTSVAFAEEKAAAIKVIEEKLAFDINKLEEDKKKKESQTYLERLDNELKFLQIRQESVTEGTIQYYDSQREILEKSLFRELAAVDDKLLNEKIKTEEAEKEKVAIKEKYSKLSAEINKREIATYLQYVNTGLSVISGFLSKQTEINSLAMDKELKAVGDNAAAQDKIKEKYFYKNRDAQKGQAIISTLQSAISAYSSLAVIPVVGPALGAIAAAAALAFGYKQVKLIGEQTYQSSVASGSSGAAAANPTMANYGRNYEKGGMIGGERHAQGGTLIEAEKGEAIMTRGAVTMFAPMLSMMNQMGGGTSFAKSAMTTSFDAPVTAKPAQEQAPIIVKSYVVSGELTSEQNKQARLKDLSTL